MAVDGLWRLSCTSGSVKSGGSTDREQQEHQRNLGKLLGTIPSDGLAGARPAACTKAWVAGGSHRDPHQRRAEAKATHAQGREECGGGGAYHGFGWTGEVVWRWVNSGMVATHAGVGDEKVGTPNSVRRGGDSAGRTVEGVGLFSPRLHTVRLRLNRAQA